MNGLKKDKVKVLHILETLDCGGIETLLLNLYRQIDREKIQFDFLTLQNKKDFFYEKEIQKLGGRVFRYKQLPTIFLKHVFNILFAIKKYGPYDAVHVHYTNFNGFALLLARLCGVKILLSHVHLFYVEPSSKLKKLYHCFFDYLLGFKNIIRLACSQKAGLSVYKKHPFTVISNGVVLSKFSYNETVRNRLRNQLHITNEFVIAHSGRMEQEKNHLFSLDIFKELLQLNPHSVLIFMGNGSLWKTINRKIHDLNIQKQVKLLGFVDNTSDVLQAADAFLFPSSWEALGLALIEAQAAGLPCLAADNIPQEAFIINTTALSLTASAKQWAQILCSFKEFHRKDVSAIIRDAGFDLANSANILQNIYLKDKNISL